MAAIYAGVKRARGFTFRAGQHGILRTESRIDSMPVLAIYRNDCPVAGHHLSLINLLWPDIVSLQAPDLCSAARIWSEPKASFFVRP